MTGAVEAIAGVTQTLPGLEALTAAAQQPQGSFAAKLDGLLEGANNDVQAADVQMQKLAAGDADSLHRVMIEMENAHLSLGLLVQVRNRLVEAYQDILRMQI